MDLGPINPGGPKTVTEEQWFSNNRGFVRTAANSALALRRVIHQIKNHNDKGKDIVKRSVFILYQGTVMSFDDFYLGRKAEKVSGALRDLDASKPGFPRMIRLKPTDIDGTPDGKIILAANPFNRALIYPKKEDALETMRKHPNGAYVIACPVKLNNSDVVFILRDPAKQLTIPKEHKQGWPEPAELKIA